MPGTGPTPGGTTTMMTTRELPIFQVWASGYCSSDTEGSWTVPTFLGACAAPDFAAAVARVAAAADPRDRGYFDLARLTHHGCSLHPSFDAALAATGDGTLAPGPGGSCGRATTTEDLAEGDEIREGGPWENPDD